MSPEFLFVLLLFILVTIPVFIGAVTFMNRDTGEGTEDVVKELKQRVEELESKQN